MGIFDAPPEQRSTLGNDYNPEAITTALSFEDEKEVLKSFADTKALATQAEVPEHAVSPVKSSLLTFGGGDGSGEIDGSPYQDFLDISEMTQNGFKTGIEQSKGNIAWDKFKDSQDEADLEEAMFRDSELGKIRALQPEDVDKIFTRDNAINTVSSVMGQLYQRMSTYPGRVKEALEPRLQFDQALIGTTVNIFKGEFEYSASQSRGEIYKSLYASKASGLPIEQDIMKEVADTFGNVAGVLDYVGQAAAIFSGGSSVMASGTLKKATKFLGGVLEEAGTEGAQEIINNIALIHAMNLQAERDGTEMIEYTRENVLENAWQAAYGGAIGGGGMAAVGAGATQTVKSGSKFSANAVKAIRNRAETEKLAAMEQRVKEDRLELNRKLQDNAEELPGAVPIALEEIREYHNQDGVTGTSITDASIDDAVVEFEDAMDAAGVLMDEVEVSMGPMTEAFDQSIREVLTNSDQATLIMRLVDSRANALGTTTEALMEHLNLTLINAPDAEIGTKTRPSADTNATTEFLEDGQKVIRAFQGADISSMVHELAHVFRKDVTGTDLSALESWAGVTEGGVWTTVAEEKFARGFERYMTDGVAPSPELENVFKRFKRWMTDVYKDVSRSPIDIELTPAITKVFDNMLAGENQARFDINSSNQAAKVLEQRKEPKTGNKATAKKDAIEELNETRSKKYRAREDQRRIEEFDIDELEKMEIADRLEELRSMFDSGSKFEYQRKKAELKAILERKRGRSKVVRQHAQGIDRIAKLLKRNRVKGKKKLMSTMDYATQEMVTGLNEVFNSVRKLSDAREYVSNVDTGIVPLEDIDPVKYELAKNLSYKSSGTVAGLKGFEESVKGIIQGGKLASPAMENYRQKILVVHNSVNDIIGGAQNVQQIKNRVTEDPTEAHKQRQSEKSVRTIIGTATLGSTYLFGMGGLMNMITAYSDSGMGDSLLSRTFDFFDNRQQQNKEVREQTEALDADFDEIYGSANGYQRNKFRTTHVRKDIDLGAGGLLKSRAQLRQVWMYMQEIGTDPNMRQLLENSGYSDESLQAVANVLTDADKEFVQRQMEFYNDDGTYDQNNEVHKRVYGADLGRHEVYAPRKAVVLQERAASGKSEDISSQLQHDAFTRITPQSIGKIKMRTEGNKHALVIEGDLGLHQGYVLEMAHFRNFAEKIRLANSVFSDRTFRALVISEYGTGVLKEINKAIADIGADGASVSNRYPLVDKFRAGFVTSSLGLSVGVMMKQGISVVNFWQHLPSSAYFSAMASPVEMAKIFKGILDSEYVQNRVMERDIKNYTGTIEYKRFALNPSIKNMMMANVKFGDKMAIAFGGAVTVKHFIDNRGMGMKTAIHEMSRMADRTQQSGALEEQSGLQRGGSFGKFATQYSTGPVQAIRQEVEAIKGMFSGRVGYRKGIKTLFIYHVLVPVMYSLAGSMIAGEEEEDTWNNMMLSAATGPIGSTYAVGRAIHGAIMRVFGARGHPNSSMLSQVVNDVANFASGVTEGDVDEMITATPGMLQSMSVISGRAVPIKRISNMAQNVVEGDMAGATFGTKLKD